MLDTIDAKVSRIETTFNSCDGELNVIATHELPKLRRSIDGAKTEIADIKKEVFERLDD